jgi:hypothetical protein
LKIHQIIDAYSNFPNEITYGWKQKNWKLRNEKYVYFSYSKLHFDVITTCYILYWKMQAPIIVHEDEPNM